MVKKLSFHSHTLKPVKKITYLKMEMQIFVIIAEN